jgi:cytosine/adenosine deaminase-related metal-dependent hydrolase
MSSSHLASAFFVSFVVAAGCSSGKSSSSSASTSTSSSGTGGSGTGGSMPGDAGQDGPVTPPSACTVASKGTSGVVLRGMLLTPAMALTGEVLVDGTGKIACADVSCSATAGYAAATVIDCQDSVISPGLINAHDHTSYDTTGPIPHGMTRWDHRNGWRTGAGGEPKLNEPKATGDPATLAAAELRFVLSGTTSIIGSGGIGGLARNLAAYSAPTELEGLTGPTVYFDTFPLGDENGTELISGCAYPGPNTPANAFAGGAAYAPHISEGVNSAAENEFTCMSGSLGLVTSQTAIIHAVGLNATDINAIAQAQAKVIWSPRSNIDLYGNTAEVTVMKTLGITLAMGTDWHASGSMNMLRELQCADFLNQSYLAKAFTDQELWMMATKNGALAAKFDGQIGELKAGLFADVAVFSGTTTGYRTVLEAGVEEVRLVMRGGKVLYGDANIVSALATSCGALDVCGVPKQICLDVPMITLANVQSAAAAIYPLYFCKGTTPMNEPSCVPYRNTYPNGETSTDRDGDGVPDTSDDCPGVFNPVRPMDGAAQADVNANGIGDVCDPNPAK